MNLLENTGRITSLARITARPNKRKELFMTITSLVDRIRREEGCRIYRFYGDASHHDSFMLVGEWETQNDWERHTRSEHFAVLLGSLELLSTEKYLDFTLLSPVETVSSFPGAETASGVM